MSTKQIQFNPLFLVGGTSKTKKKSAPKTAPLISPNVLKNKLLKKIKEHKNKENNEHNKMMAEKKKLEKAAANTKTLTSFEEEDNKNITEYTDDFNDSLKYLKSLKKKHDEEEEQKQLLVNLELPAELMESFSPSPPSAFPSPYSSPPFSPSPPVMTPSSMTSPPIPSARIAPPPPWGILKNGSNPTYRQYNNKTLKKNIPTTISTVPLTNERETKLQEMKNRAKLENNSPSNNTSTTNTKQTIKRTIRRKYLLGKSKNKRVVGVLLKDKNTRKQIIQAQKDLKGEPINDVKKYLRNHNLIKIGTFAPNDVVRKMYESAMFAGDITNNNEETMLHNFVKDNNEEPIF